MQINPYLSFDGQCSVAFKFYEEALRGKIAAMISYADTPMVQQMPDSERNKIAHARLTVGNAVLMGGDAPGGRFEPMKGCSVTLSIDDPTEAERVYRALAPGGTETMPIQETFWAKRFGMLTDRFGTAWMINCEKPM